MFKYINQCDIYVGLWCFYMLQGVLYSPGIINQLLQLIMLLWSMTALLRYIFESRLYLYSSILKSTFILIIMYVIYGTIHIMFDTPIIGQAIYYYLQSSLNSLAPIFLLYHFTMNRKLTSDRIRIYFPILVVICILLYYNNETKVLLESNKEEITNNAGYYFVSLIPFLFFYSKKPILQYVFMGLILLYVFMCMKRGAILIGVLGTMILLYANMKNSTRWSRFLIILLTTTILVGISKYIDYMVNNSTYFMARVEQTLDGNSSGRDVIYENLWDTLYLESNPFYFIFGRGAESTLKVVGKFAHQDWLETFCNNGFIGVFILFNFFYAFGKNAWMSRMYFPKIMFYSFLSLFIIIFSKTFFSMSIQNLDFSSVMLIGYFSFELDNLEQSDVYETVN